MRHAIERHEFQLHYQPIVALDTGRIAGYEALVRWQHAERGLLQPASFLPVADELGLIVALDEWVLYEACRQAQRWRELLGGEGPWVSVNLSAKSLGVRRSAAAVAGALRTSRLAAVRRCTSRSPRAPRCPIRRWCVKCSATCARWACG